MNLKQTTKSGGQFSFGRLAASALSVLLLATPVGAAGLQSLQGHRPEAVARLQAAGRLAATKRLDLAIGLPLRNREALTNLLAELYDPASTNFHQYLTPEQFAEKFGPTEADYQKLIDFARTNGLVVTGTHPNRTLLDVNGSMRDIERVFHVNMGVYQHPTEARTFYAPDVEPSIDLDIPVLHVSGLDNYYVPQPHVHGRPVTMSKMTLSSPHGGSGPGGEYWGYDFRQAYAPGITLTGSGQTVALYELEGYLASDITTYETQAGLPNVPVQNVAVDGFSFIPNNSDTNGVLEVCLDIEVAIAMAPGLSQVLVYGATNGNNFDNDILNRIATDNLARQISSSWGINVNPTTDQIFQQFAAQGQACFMAVGDTDAFKGSIGFGSDDPFLTQVGGTVLSTGASTNWTSEVVWNYNNSGQTPTNTGSSGGISTGYLIPTWQKNVSMAGNQGSTTARNVPDVAMIADNVYTVARGGSGFYTYGTSIAAPLWASFLALANQQAALNGKPAIGFINPILYSLALGQGGSSYFHDITVGNNTNTVSPNKYFAVPGYDLCTGWGSPNGTNLIGALSSYGGAIWVAFGVPGPGTGNYETPYNTLTLGVNNVSAGGTVAIKGPGSTAETFPLINKHMTIVAAGGAVTIGH